MSIWCIYVDDKGYRNSKMRKHSQDNFGRHFLLYNADKKEMKMLEEREAVNFLRKGNTVENLKLDEFNTWIESSSGSLDKITNKVGFVVLSKTVSPTGELLNVRVVDSNGEEKTLSYQEAYNLFSSNPAQNAKLSHNTIMGIKCKIPELKMENGVVSERQGLNCRLFFKDWKDFDFRLIYDGKDSSLSLFGREIHLEIERPDELATVLGTTLTNMGIIYREVPESSCVYITYDLNRYSILEIIKGLKDIEVSLNCYLVLSFVFMQNSTNWNHNGLDLSEFYKDIDPKKSIERYPVDMDIETCVSRIVRSSGTILLEKIQNFCDGFQVHFIPPLTYLTPDDVRSEFRSLSKFYLSCNITNGIQLSVLVPDIKHEKPSFFSRLFGG